MDRSITAVGQSIYEWSFSKPDQNAMVGLAKLAAAVLGTSGAVNGLACVPTGPASLQVVVNPGEIYQLANLEATTCGTLPVDTTHQILKQGIQLDPVTLPTMAAPGTAGQSINYLIEASYSDQDVSVDPTTGNPNIVLQFYNSASPSTPFTGPNNTGVSSNTFRKGVVTLTVKAGAAATTGSQVTPTPDAGTIGLWVVTVANGQTQITAPNISPYPGAPFIKSLTAVQSAASGVVGSMRYASMVVSAAAASATFTADEIVVETALGGVAYRLGSYSQTINLAATGAGGMDTGTAPVSGYVALYAIYNPVTGAASILATNATASAAPSVYGGANMPAGYTASALISAWPTNASGQFVVGFQRDRSVGIAQATALTTNTIQATPAALSLASIVPPNARTASGQVQVSSTAASNLVLTVSPVSTSGGLGNQGILNNTTAAGGGSNAVYRNLPILTSQTIYWTSTSSAGTPTFIINVWSYDI